MSPLQGSSAPGSAPSPYGLGYLDAAPPALLFCAGEVIIRNLGREKPQQQPTQSGSYGDDVLEFVTKSGIYVAKGYSAGRIFLSVLCKRHHFEAVLRKPYPF